MFTKKNIVKISGLLLVIAGLAGILSMNYIIGSYDKNSGIRLVQLSESDNLKNQNNIGIVATIEAIDNFKMPDTGTEVIKADVQLFLNDSETKNEQVLVDWHKESRFVSIKDGAYSRNFDLSDYMLDENNYIDENLIQLHYKDSADYYKISYFNHNFEIEKAEWKGKIGFRLLRSYLKNNAKVVIVTGINSTGNWIEPQNGGKRILIHNQMHIKTTSVAVIILKLILYILLILTGYILTAGNHFFYRFLIPKIALISAK